VNTDKRTDDELNRIIAEWSNYAEGCLIKQGTKVPRNYCRDLKNHERETNPI